MIIDEQNKTTVNFLMNQNTAKESKGSNQNDLSFQDLFGTTQKVQTSEDTRTEEEKKQDVDKLKKEIKAELRRGLTPNEVKSFETLLERIKDKLRDKNYDKKELEKMIDELQEKISKLKDNIKGESIFRAEDAIIEAKQNKEAKIDNNEEVTSTNNDTSNQSHNQLEFLQGIKNS